jgi:hypothetical protein
MWPRALRFSIVLIACAVALILLFIRPRLPLGVTYHDFADKNRAWLKKLLPYSDYLCSISGYTFAENFWNVFDQLVAPTAFYHSQDEVVDWFRTAAINEVQIGRHNGNSWRGTGLMPGS